MIVMLGNMSWFVIFVMFVGCYLLCLVICNVIFGIIIWIIISRFLRKRLLWRNIGVFIVILRWIFGIDFVFIVIWFIIDRLCRKDRDF